MTLPPLRTGSCLIGGHRYPAIVGEAKGMVPELFVCGVHIDRFIRTLPPAEVRQFLQQGISIQEDGVPSESCVRNGLPLLLDIVPERRRLGKVVGRGAVSTQNHMRCRRCHRGRKTMRPAPIAAVLSLAVPPPPADAQAPAPLRRK